MIEEQDWTTGSEPPPEEQRSSRTRLLEPQGCRYSGPRARRQKHDWGLAYLVSPGVGVRKLAAQMPPVFGMTGSRLPYYFGRDGRRKPGAAGVGPLRRPGCRAPLSLSFSLFLLSSPRYSRERAGCLGRVSTVRKARQASRSASRSRSQ